MRFPTLVSRGLIGLILWAAPAVIQAASDPAPDTTGNELVTYKAKKGETRHVELVVLTPVDADPEVRFTRTFSFKYRHKYVGTTAKIVAELDLDDAWNVTAATLVSAEPPEAAEAVIRSWRQAKFAPATKFSPAANRQLGVRCRIQLTCEFGL